MDATAQPRPFAIGGHVSFWSGCYVAGCTALAGILLGGDDLLLPTIAAFSLGLFVYVLHRFRRAKVVAHQTGRRDYLLGHPSMQVAIMFGFGVSAIVATWMLHPWAVLLVIVAPAARCVVPYAPTVPTGARPFTYYWFQ